MLARFICAAVLGSSLFVGPAAAYAEPKDTPAPAASASAAPEHPHDGGIIAGKITSVDLQRNLITVNRTEINVMPSTQIQGSDSGYRSITDLRTGMLVHVYTSQIAGRYIAQIITLR